MKIKIPPNYFTHYRRVIIPHPGEIDNLFARTAAVFQDLGPDRQENLDLIVSRACTLLGAAFSFYIDHAGKTPVIRSKNKFPPKGYPPLRRSTP